MFLNSSFAIRSQLYSRLTAAPPSGHTTLYYRRIVKNCEPKFLFIR